MFNPKNQQELLLAEKWAKLNRLPFPPIDTSVFEREGMKELYIFRHPTDPHCPIVFHFPLTNKTFRDFKAPGERKGGMSVLTPFIDSEIVCGENVE